MVMVMAKLFSKQKRGFRNKSFTSPVIRFPLESVREMTVSVTGFPLASRR